MHQTPAYAKPTIMDHGSIADHTFYKGRKPNPPGFSR